jgi:hypothetical protein
MAFYDPGLMAGNGLVLSGCMSSTSNFPPIISLDLENDQKFKDLRDEVKLLSRMLGAIVKEDPKILEKYDNVKRAWEEYCLFRDLVVNGNNDA